MECMSLLSFAACADDAEFRDSLRFPCAGISPETIPPLLRRRSSQAMQLAFSAATIACDRAGCSPADLPSVFASVAGEIRTTDQLCVELARADGIVSPSAFHNSVQNTVAGYWSIVQQCTQPATALAAGRDTFAMALLEAWCQLSCQGGELLMVCYDENWPAHLAPGCGKPAFACALVLADGAEEGSIARIGRPYRGTSLTSAQWGAQLVSMPVLSAIPLLALAAGDGKQQTDVSLGPDWLGNFNSG